MELAHVLAKRLGISTSFDIVLLSALRLFIKIDPHQDGSNNGEDDPDDETVV
jgi:hypothetical protein